MPDEVIRHIAGQERSASGKDDMDQIREILFGDESRHLEQGISDVAKDLLRLRGDLQSQIRSEVEGLRRRLQGELDKLSGLLAQEQGARTGALERLGAELRQIANDLGARVEGLEADVTADLQGLKRELLQEIIEAESRVSEQQGASTRTLEAELAQLRESATEREQLAGLLEGLAARIRGQAPETGGR